MFLEDEGYFRWFAHRKLKIINVSRLKEVSHFFVRWELSCTQLKAVSCDPYLFLWVMLMTMLTVFHSLFSCYIYYFCTHPVTTVSGRGQTGEWWQLLLKCARCFTYLCCYTITAVCDIAAFHTSFIDNFYFSCDSWATSPLNNVLSCR